MAPRIEIEEIINKCRKESGNRLCAECRETNPQYICTTFNIFVCNLCCGIHREFSHRIKSISISTFTMNEVKSLLDGGNQKSNEHFLKRLEKNILPPRPGNIARIRSWIHDKYTLNRWAGDKINDPRNKPKQITFKSPQNLSNSDLEDEISKNEANDLLQIEDFSSSTKGNNVEENDVEGFESDEDWGEYQSATFINFSPEFDKKCNLKLLAKLQGHKNLSEISFNQSKTSKQPQKDDLFELFNGEPDHNSQIKDKPDDIFDSFESDLFSLETVKNIENVENVENIENVENVEIVEIVEKESLGKITEGKFLGEVTDLVVSGSNVSVKTKNEIDPFSDLFE